MSLARDNLACAHAPTACSEAYDRVRGRSLALCAALAPEDTVVQSMPETSPTKWHLAHTTWFFERFVLGRGAAGPAPLHPEWHLLYNSYYQSAGPMHARSARGLLTRPTLAEVRAYRAHIDAEVLARLEAPIDARLDLLITLGLHHEQQHQELMLTDLKHLFSCNPLQPAYLHARPPAGGRATPLRFVSGERGIVAIGFEGKGFAYDNELPRHSDLLHPHAIAQRPVTNAEYAEFIRDGGYRAPLLWMSEGWATVQREGWSRPLYWAEDLAHAFTLGGPRALDPHAPVCHVSFFEADAFARWAGARLPLETEWETLAATLDPERGHFADDGALEPLADATPEEDGPRQMFGDVWEWTASPYVAYPGFRPLPGALGEYNGKFMCGQWVLRGGSCATPRGHVRASYRNFFYPRDRWQFSGIRLAKDLP
jgi:ergothioneine biosynthesis protein EgtB